MILVETKPDVINSASLGASTKEEEPKVSFSQMLKGATKKGEEIVQNGALVLALDPNADDLKVVTKQSKKGDSLLSLLKNDKTLKKDFLDKESMELIELNPKLTNLVTNKELKVLIGEAKEYLKTKILSSSEYKNLQNQELPKTLKGLATLAKNIGIDISKITIQEVGFEVKPSEVKTLQTLQDSTKQSIKKPTIDLKSKMNNQKVIQTAQVQVEEKSFVEDKKVEVSQKIESLKPIALFKEQTLKQEHTTEQIVQVKQFKVESKTPKDKADDTLKLLLRGEKPLQNSSANLTADFSVATAKVIAPSAASDVTKGLEKLLHSETSSSEKPETTTDKVESMSVHKADSFEVKLNEAKQMIKYISQDVKTAIEDYKSPFTRVKVQLNPQKLGEVDLTIVQRGKNLHVNISSNNTAINTLSMNANELKVQLNNSGINNATLNFNNSSQNGDTNAGGQQQSRQNEKDAHEEYNYFDNEEANEEILSSLEIIVPHYV